MNRTEKKNDHITLRDAMESPVWMALYAAEPERNIDVTMTYADLFVIYNMAQTLNRKPIDCSKIEI